MKSAKPQVTPAAVPAQAAPQVPDTQEMMALKLVMSAAEKYLNTLDDIAKPAVTQHLQQAVTILVNAITPKSEEAVEAE